MHILRPALGQMASLGTLYDARTDVFLPVCILNAKVPDSAITRTEKIVTKFEFSADDSLQERLHKMGLNTDLQASYLAGYVNAKGSGCYLNKIQDAGGMVEVSMHHWLTVMEETLEIRNKDVADFLALDYIQGGFATHVVVGITLGAHSIATAKHPLPQSDCEGRAEVTAALEASLASLKLEVLGEGITCARNHDSASFGDKLEVHIDSDVLPDRTVMPTTLEAAYNFLRRVPQYISESDGGNGKPVTYTLLPLQILAFLQGNNMAAANTPFVQLSGDTLGKFVDVFAEMAAMQLALSEYHARINEHQDCVPAKHIKEIEEQRSVVTGREAALRSRFAMTLRDARAGEEKPESLWELLKEFSGEDLSLRSVCGAIERYIGKMNFFDTVTEKGAEYIGFTSTLQTEEFKVPQIYVFRVNWDSHYGSAVLHENIAILLELLEGDGVAREGHIVVRDCDSTDETVDRPYITHEHNTVIISEDLAEDRKERAGKSFMQYDMVVFEQGRHKRPIEMAKVTLTCPGKACGDYPRDWICHQCHASILFGYSDICLYCDCGRGLYNSWTYQCTDPEHGDEWSKHADNTLLGSLQALKPLEPLNVLILGETGVGKSTFINAFVNYLTYDTLGDAMKGKRLQCIIPFSFATQVVDEACPRRSFVTKTVCIHLP